MLWNKFKNKCPLAASLWGGVKMFWTMFKYKHIFSYDGFEGSYHKKLKSGCFWTLSKTNSRFGKLGLSRADVKTAL